MIENNVINSGLIIYKLLSEDNKVKSYVDDRIYPIVGDNANFGDKEIPFPYIVFKRNNANITKTKDGSFYGQITLNLLVLSNDYKQSVDIANAVNNALLKYEDKTIQGIYLYQIDMASCSEDYLNDAFSQQIYYNITIK